MARQSPTRIKKAFNAQRVFTDKDTPLEAFSNALGKSQTRGDVRVLNFHGIGGGQGKTALCEQFTITLEGSVAKLLTVIIVRYPSALLIDGRYG